MDARRRTLLASLVLLNNALIAVTADACVGCGPRRVCLIATPCSEVDGSLARAACRHVAPPGCCKEATSWTCTNAPSPGCDDPGDATLRCNYVSACP